jgi:hypothetical protein
MTLRSIVTAGVYVSMVPLLSGVGRVVVLPAPIATVADVAGAADQTAAAAAPGDLPVHAGHVERRDAASGLRAAIASLRHDNNEPRWLVWTVPAVEQRRDHGDGNWQRDWREESACTLTADDLDCNRNVGDGTTTLLVFVRLVHGSIDRVTFIDARRRVEAGAQTVIWLDGVRPSESVALLADLVRDEAQSARGGDEPSGDRHERGRKPALAVLALTDDPTADSALETFVRPDSPGWLRRDAAFWLGAARGAAGGRIIDRLAGTDTDDSFREHLTFVLTLTPGGGIDRLLDMARHDASGQVRGQALFWLAQKAGERAASEIRRAVDDDPDSEVRIRAVFALSQLPKDEGVPKLIELARSHRDPAVRKQAMFWLGQSGDARAVAFFEQVLTQP